jgi:hypothetical protein
MKWIIKNWPIATPFLALYTTVLLFLFVFRQDFPLFLIWIQTPVYFLHQFEEYILPGGFVSFFNKKMLGSDKDEYPLDKTSSFWINVPIIFMAFPLSAILAGQFGLSIGVWTVYFSIINSVSHVGIFFRDRYNPGFWVSLLVNIPVGVFTIVYFISNQILPLEAHIVGGLIGLTIQGVIMLYGFKVLKPRV